MFRKEQFQTCNIYTWLFKISVSNWNEFIAYWFLGLVFTFSIIYYLKVTFFDRSFFITNFDKNTNIDTYTSQLKKNPNFEYINQIWAWNAFWDIHCIIRLDICILWYEFRSRWISQNANRKSCISWKNDILAKHHWKKKRLKKCHVKIAANAKLL